MSHISGYEMTNVVIINLDVKFTNTIAAYNSIFH